MPLCTSSDCVVDVFFCFVALQELAKKIARNFVTEVLRLAQHRQQFAAQERS